MHHCVKVANPAGLVPLPPIEGVRLAAGGAKHPPRGFRGIPPDTPLVTFVVKRKSPGAPSMARPCSRGAPASVGAGATCPCKIPPGAGRSACIKGRVQRMGRSPSSHIGPRRDPRSCKKAPGEPQSPFTYTPKRTKSCTPTCNRTERKIKKEEALPEPMGRASLHVASDDTSACSVKRNMRSGKNNCPAALENCQEICYNY